MDPLFIATSRCNYHAVGLLIESNADVNLIDWNGHTPLYWACKQNILYSPDHKSSNDAFPVVQYLLNYGAKVNLRGRNICCHIVCITQIQLLCYEP